MNTNEQMQNEHVSQTARSDTLTQLTKPKHVSFEDSTVTQNIFVCVCVCLHRAL
jgi:hypothetical protein